jgi:uncharacterized protein
MPQHVTFESDRPSGKIELEGELSLPDRKSDAPAVVLCHPHPAGGGEMSVGLFEVMDLRIVRAGLAVLRFNFGGVGRSGGHFTDGLEEPQDVAAAFEFLKGTAGVDEADVSIAGWSFGAWMCLLALADGLPASSCVAIAPPLMLYDWRQYTGRIAGSPAVRSYIVGSNDQFCPLDFLRAFAEAISEEDAGRLMVMPATDHYLGGREDIVAELTIEHLSSGGQV